MNIPYEKFDKINGKGKFGDVKFIKAVLNDKIDRSSCFPC